MNTYFLATLLFVFASMHLQHCDNITEPVSISNIDISGTWHEIDTSIGSEIWLFNDSTVIHVFKGLDTIANILHGKSEMAL